MLVFQETVKLLGKDVGEFSDFYKLCVANKYIEMGKMGLNQIPGREKLAENFGLELKEKHFHKPAAKDIADYFNKNHIDHAVIRYTHGTKGHNMNLYFEDENGDGKAQAEEIKVANAGHRADTGISIDNYDDTYNFNPKNIVYIEYYENKNCN